MLLPAAIVTGLLRRIPLKLQRPAEPSNPSSAQDAGRAAAATEALGLDSTQELQDFLASMILSECAYKKLEVQSASALAAKIAGLAARFRGLLQLQAVQVTLRDLAQHAQPHHHYIVAAGGGAMYVAFMGTKQGRDMFTDLRAVHAPVWATAADAAAVTAAAAGAGGEAAHSGFLARARAVDVAALYAAAAATPGVDRLVLCGHSLGGAVAKLCTLRLLRDAPPAPRQVALRCITFATPAVGNVALARAVEAAGWAPHFTTFYHPEDQLMRALRLLQLRGLFHPFGATRFLGSPAAGAATSPSDPPPAGGPTTGIPPLASLSARPVTPSPGGHPFANHSMRAYRRRVGALIASHMAAHTALRASAGLNVTAPHVAAPEVRDDLVPPMAIAEASTRPPLGDTPVAITVEARGLRLHQARSVRAVWAAAASAAAPPATTPCTIVAREVVGAHGPGSGAAPAHGAGWWRRLRGLAARASEQRQRPQGDDGRCSRLVVRVPLPAARRGQAPAARLIPGGPAPGPLSLILQSDFQVLETAVEVVPWRVGVLALPGSRSAAAGRLLSLAAGANLERKTLVQPPPAAATAAIAAAALPAVPGTTASVPEAADSVMSEPQQGKGGQLLGMGMALAAAAVLGAAAAVAADPSAAPGLLPTGAQLPDLTTTAAAAVAAAAASKGPTNPSRLWSRLSSIKQWAVGRRGPLAATPTAVLAAGGMVVIEPWAPPASAKQASNAGAAAAALPAVLCAVACAGDALPKAPPTPPPSGCAAPHLPVPPGVPLVPLLLVSADKEERRAQLEGEACWRRLLAASCGVDATAVWEVATPEDVQALWARGLMPALVAADTGGGMAAAAAGAGKAWWRSMLPSVVLPRARM